MSVKKWTAAQRRAFNRTIAMRKSGKYVKHSAPLVTAREIRFIRLLREIIKSSHRAQT